LRIIEIKMTQTDILNYIGEGAKWLAIGGGAYFITLLGCQISTSAHFQKKIESKKELEEIMKKEAEKLGVDCSRIDIIYPSDGTYVTKDKRDGRFKMNFWEEGLFNTTGGIRHELYHIKDCDDKKPNFFRHWFKEEPRATLYGTFGIKI
jgi:hypothetical protein